MAALLADGLAPADSPAEFTDLAVSGAQTRDLLQRQTPAALDLRPDVVSVVIGVNDTLRCTFDIHAVAARLDQVYGVFRAHGTVLLTACLPDPGGRCCGCPGRWRAGSGPSTRSCTRVSERHGGGWHVHGADGGLDQRPRDVER